MSTKSPTLLSRHTPLPGGGKSPAQLVRESNRWRDNYNPLRSLVISKVVSLLEAGERGDFAELQLTVRKIEKRYPVLKGLKSRRLAALQKFDWNIQVKSELPAGATAEMAETQRRFLRHRYELIDNLSEAIEFLALAEIRGFSILQKHYSDVAQASRLPASQPGRLGYVTELHWLPQWTFARDGQFGDFFYNRDSQFGALQETLGEENRLGGNGLPLTDFVIRETQSPLYEIALVAFVNWSMARKDWASFVEIFGLPNGVVIMPQNIPKGDEEKYRVGAESVASGVSGALPHGSDVRFPTSNVRGDAPFKEFCDAQDADLVLAGTGGLLSMLTAATGLGKGPTDEHADAFDEISQGDAKDISEVFQKQFDQIELAAEFPGQPVLAYFQLAAQDKEDVSEIVNRVVSLSGAGYEASAHEVSEKVGLQLQRVTGSSSATKASSSLNPQSAI